MKKETKPNYLRRDRKPCPKSCEYKDGIDCTMPEKDGAGEHNICPDVARAEKKATYAPCTNCSRNPRRGTPRTAPCPTPGSAGCALDMTPPPAHTPGPWVMVPLSGDVTVIEAEGGGFVCTTEGFTAGPDEKEAARLIAAAPALLAALEAIQAAFVHKPGDEKGNKARTAPLKYCNAEFSAALNAARLAVSKAKGE